MDCKDVFGRLTYDLVATVSSDNKHYTQGCTGPALYAGLYRPALFAGISRVCFICRAVQALLYMQGFAGPALLARLFRP